MTWPARFDIIELTSFDNGIDGDRLSKVRITWVASTSDDVDHYIVRARAGSNPSFADTIPGIADISPAGPLEAEFDWTDGEVLHVTIWVFDDADNSSHGNPAVSTVTVAEDTPE